MIGPIGSASRLAILAVVAVGVLALTAAQTRSDASVFERYFGTLEPFVVMAGSAIAGGLAIVWLDRQGSFTIWRGLLGGRAVAIGAAVVLVLAIAAIAADVTLRFAEDTNVAVPDAWRFYPVMAFFVETIVHALPLALLVAILGRSGTAIDARFWALVIPIVALEAGFQAFTAGSVGLGIFTGVQLLVFGIIELLVWQRYGFLPMYAFRLAYYAVWHIAWGWARLRWLF